MSFEIGEWESGHGVAWLAAAPLNYSARTIWRLHFGRCCCCRCTVRVCVGSPSALFSLFTFNHVQNTIRDAHAPMPRPSTLTVKD